jgi:alpha-methylacyl-CoA racemase
VSDGPLAGYRVVEMAGIGPGPFAAMLLADLGAEVVRVERTQVVGRTHAVPTDLMQRGRRSVAVDLKHPDGAATLLDLVERADALLEGFRPGVMERLGVGPETCLARNPKLVYGRMTGWGQDGPYAAAAGHDINYIALAGALAHIGRAGAAPVPPLNLVGDFGGGGMFLALGVVCALLEAQRSGEGQVVDAAMVDGTAVLMTMFWSLRNIGLFDESSRGANLLDSGAHFYDVYECADGGWISIGSIEPQFYALLLDALDLADDPALARQMDAAAWPALKERVAAAFRTRTRDEWCERLETTDVCFAPVLTMSEAAVHPHNVARRTFVEVAGVTQPAPAPRFSRTPGAIAGPPSPAGAHTREVLADWGLSADRIDALHAAGAVASAPSDP